MATTTIGAPGVTFPDATVQTSAGATSVNVMTVGTASGTWTKPATVKSIKVTVVGGGGNGGPAGRGSPVPSGLTTIAYGSTSGGGGGGGYSQRMYPAASLPGPQPYTVGGVAGTSSFGVAPITVVTATGGASAAGSTGTPGGSGSAGGGAGGAGSNGNINIAGQDGGTGATGANVGGSTVLGFGAFSNAAASVGNAGKVYGGAGSGATINPSTSTGTALAAAAGSAGVVIIEEFY